MTSLTRRYGMTVQPKRLYFVQRHPSLTREEFIPRWRQHGRLAMHFMARQDWANVARYVHCDALHDHGLAGIDQRWDGMGIVLFRDQEARRRHLGFAEARVALEADEDAAFAQRVNRNGLVAREQLLRDGPSGGVKLVRVFKRRVGVSAPEFDRCWRDLHVPEAQGAFDQALRRHAQNWPLAPEHAGGWGLDCDVVEELWFASVDALRGVAAGNPDAMQSSALQRFAEQRLAIVVSELDLYAAA